MPRTGLLVGLAVLLIAGAVGVLVWTNFLGQSNTPAATEAQPASSLAPETTREAQLVKDMMTAASADGYSATFSQQDVGKWAIAPGNKLEGFGLNGTGTVFARLTSSNALDKQSIAWPTIGLSATMPVEFANLSAGRRVEVGVVARSAQSNGSAEISVLYASRQAGNSGWQSFPLKAEFELLKFNYDVNKIEGGYTNGPMLIIHSDASGGGKSVELLGMYVKALPQ